jgi:hypothetical protein
MKSKYLISLSISILVLAGGIVQIADAQNRTVLNEAQRISGDQFTLVTRTPKGAYVYALKQPSAEMLAAIDRGLGSLFEVARKNRYRSRLNYRDYTIYIAKADREKDASGAYSPDIAVGAAQYTGTGYDKGGYIYAAGIVVALNPCAFMIAEHTKDLDRVADAVRYEGEHLVLYHNDRSRYLTTADHSKGGGHPILQ